MTHDDMRVLCLDYGLRRIGLAVSDPTRTVATGLPSLEWDGRDLEPAYETLQTIVDGYADNGPVETLLLGIPLAADGSEGASAKRIRAFGEKLGARLGLPVEYQDERHTTEDARIALRDTGWSGKKKKQRLDVMSALLILRSYLDARR